ncbi:NAD-dependent protein lipoamidase sirtuin-4, mitochondrial-like isoform X2 [Anneissia japonica]|uniref:NAD-dependent protein lipoamidase sirtuin-4, mitochondrial-like isoform X2 n=1 Tax=Anneissia japonica TaxID=1529436 RepID=UPI00142555CC|nr:NAD-dependent protein lipoamidase sirtuin-4, mitochondrial-like isoform X2 [Anneissia japonica]
MPGKLFPAVSTEMGLVRLGNVIQCHPGIGFMQRAAMFANLKQRSHSTQTVTKDDLSYVPASPPFSQENINQLQDFVDKSKKLFVLTGAGLSTESGIPDYRSEGVGLYARTNHRPMQYNHFLQSAERRRQYWARNFVGWRKYKSFVPNLSHTALSSWEKMCKINWLATQNVDGLHLKAGSERVTELHGSLHRVKCLSCFNVISRNSLQKQLIKLNPNFVIKQETMAGPDGDVLLSLEDMKNFVVPECEECGGILKPNIVFFGDNVQKTTVAFLKDRVRDADGFLVVGSSLQVYSGYRFALEAAEWKKPIAIINIGPTRADHLATLKINAKLGDILPEVVVS